MAKREEIFSMYNKDAKNKYETGVGNNKKLMPKEMFTNRQTELNKNKQEEKPKNNSLVAENFGNKKTKTYEDVKRENGNDPKKMAEWLNNNPDYKAGNLTKKGMDEFGYAQGADGKWSIKQPTTEPTTEDTTTTTEDTTTTKPTTITTTPYTPNTDTTTIPTIPTTPTTPNTDTTTTEGVSNELENLKAENEDIKNETKKYTDKNGKVDKDAAFASMDQYQQRMIENGSATIDKNGNFKFKPVGKGWETWATLLSAGVSAVLLILGALLFRMTGVAISLLKTGLSKRERLFCMVACTPKATVQAAIGAIPLSMGLECGNIVLTVAVLSILITAPFGAICVDNLYKRLLEKR